MNLIKMAIWFLSSVAHTHHSCGFLVDFLSLSNEFIWWVSFRNQITFAHISMDSQFFWFMQIICQKWVQFQLTLFPLCTVHFGCIVSQFNVNSLGKYQYQLNTETNWIPNPTECESFDFLIIVHCNINFQLCAPIHTRLTGRCTAHRAQFVIIYIFCCLHPRNGYLNFTIANVCNTHILVDLATALRSSRFQLIYYSHY